MAGKARFNALVDTLNQLGGLEWIEEQLAEAKTLLDVSEDLTRRTGLPITRYMLTRWIDAQPEGAAVTARARTQGASTLVEQRAKLVQSTIADRDEIALSKLKAEEMRDRAGWYDKQYSMQKGAEVVINVQSLHLDALRVRSPELSKSLEIKQLGDGTA
jgi:hypothetical protein